MFLTLQRDSQCFVYILQHIHLLLQIVHLSTQSLLCAALRFAFRLRNMSDDQRLSFDAMESLRVCTCTKSRVRIGIYDGVVIDGVQGMGSEMYVLHGGDGGGATGCCI